MSSPKNNKTRKNKKNVSFSVNNAVRSFSPINKEIKGLLFYNKTDFVNFQNDKNKKRKSLVDMVKKIIQKNAEKPKIIFTNEKDEEDDDKIKLPKGYVKKSRYSSGGKRRTYKKRRD